MASAGDRGHGAGTSPRTAGAATGGLAGVAGSVQEAGQQFASATARKAEQAWDTAGRQAQQLAATAGDTLGDFSRFAGRYPLPVFLAGVGIGFLLARALDRWPDDVARRMSEASYR
jgi:hypothetical protein